MTLRLPAEDEEAIEPEVAHANGSIAPQPQGRELGVLVIEDNPDVADTLAEWLKGMGHHVWLAATGPEGVDMVSKNRPDLVLCDLGLPDMDGVEVCRRVRGLDLGKQPKIVALTGWGREADRRRTKDAGFDEHLVKPVEVERLRSILATLSTPG
jgi:CheY-like chemotaxis protein